MKKLTKRQKTVKKVSKIRIVLTLIVVVIFTATFFAIGGVGLFSDTQPLFASQEFEIHFIDVGQGDCIFARFPDGSTLLVDTGPTSAADEVVDYLQQLFEKENIDAIDVLVLTHQDADHVGGAEAVFEAFDVNVVYRPTVYATSETKVYNYETCDTSVYNKAISAAVNEGCEMYFSSAGISWSDNSYSVEFLTPNLDYYSSSNNYSPIIRIEYSGRSFLLTGDAESVAENEAISYAESKLDCDVLKVGHHGSSYSTSEEFLSYVTPLVSIISAGADNSYGHPASDTLSRLKDVGSVVYCTIDYGSIALSVDSDGSIIMLYSNYSQSSDFPLLLTIFALAVLLIWGIKMPKFKKNTKKASI